MSRAAVVVLGGGCMGTSTAFHLAAAGVAEVLLLESVTLGAGSTSKCAGGIRVQYSDELNTRIALRSLAEFEAFQDLTGADIDFRQNGYLFLLTDQAHAAAFDSAVQFQQALSIPTVRWSREEIAERMPQLDLTGVVGGVFSPWDGVAVPEAVVQGYASAARRMGVRTQVQQPALDIVVDRERVVGVRTAEGTIHTGCVVLAAGVWSAELAARVGLTLPVYGEERWIHFTPSDVGLDDAAPLTVDFSSGFYFHRERTGLIFGGREATLDLMSAPAMARLPGLAEVPITSSWSGMYDMSPDRNAIIGGGEIEGLYYATGFSGHGFQQSPAVGEYLSELVRGVKPTLDLSALSVGRFADGAVRTEEFVI